MKHMITLILTILISFNVNAGNSRFECSNQDGSILISDNGETVTIHGASYTSDVELSDINVLGAGFGRGDVEIIRGGKRSILHKEVNNTCGRSGQVRFSQKLMIKDKESSETLAKDSFVCEYSYVYEINGDCAI